MTWILPDILSLSQYVVTMQMKGFLDTKRCQHCGNIILWHHGRYFRKADRSTDAQSLNPLPIQRYFCPNCKKTCSALPECLPSRRWYLWQIQQTALALLLAGKSVRAIAQEITPSRRTIGRWATRLKEQFHIHKDVLCGHFIDLGRNVGFGDFWQGCLSKISLAQAMRLCHVAGVPVS